MEIDGIIVRMKDIEQEAFHLVEQREELQSREQNLQYAISCIREDVEISLLLQEKHDDMSISQESLENHFHSLAERVHEVEVMLQGSEEQLQESEAVLRELENDGEDVEAGRTILEKRKRLLETCWLELKQVKGQLGFQWDKLEETSYLSSEINWTETMNTIEELAILKEIYQEESDFMPIEYQSEEPNRNTLHLPTKETGIFEDKRGNSAFRPYDVEALEAMKQYGVDYVIYKDGYPDFSPFAVQETPWGSINTTVEIGHMTDKRRNSRWDFGRRKNSHDIHTDLGNFEQADVVLCQKLNKQLEKQGIKLMPGDVQKFRGNHLVWHECADGKTMQLVPAKIHDACRHSGGVSEMKYRMAYGNYMPKEDMF